MMLLLFSSSEANLVCLARFFGHIYVSVWSTRRNVVLTTSMRKGEEDFVLPAVFGEDSLLLDCKGYSECG